MKVEKTTSVKKIPLPYALYFFGMSIFSFLAFLSLLRLIKISRLESNEPIVLHSQDMNYAAIATNLAGKILSVPTVLHQHGPYINMLSGNSKRIEQILNTLNCRLCNGIIVTDKFTKSYISRILGKDDRISVIPAGTDVSSFRNLVRVDSRYFTIGYIGRLAPEKDIKTLLMAFKEFRLLVSYPCRLMLVGDGESRVMLEELATKLGIATDVVFVGFQVDVRPF